MGINLQAQWIQQTYQDFPELEHKFLICLPGRITRLKGHETLIDLIAKLKTQYPQIHAVVVGGADVKKAAYLQELERNIRDKHLTEAITFVGHRSARHSRVACVLAILYSSLFQSSGNLWAHCT